jgi:hypothetical protein
VATYQTELTLAKLSCPRTSSPAREVLSVDIPVFAALRIFGRYGYAQRAEDPPTRWTMRDSCRGTLVRTARGVALARPRGGRGVRLTAGRSKVLR